MTALDDIRRACERLRRLPEARWAKPPQLPLGARSPLEPWRTDGPSLETLVRRSCERLMSADAGARGVTPMVPAVSVFGLADVLLALARSVASRGDASALEVLEEVAGEARRW